MRKCLKHGALLDDFGGCPYCLSGQSPPGMDEIQDLKTAAMGAEEKFLLDELEEFAEGLRRRKKENADRKM